MSAPNPVTDPIPYGKLTIRWEPLAEGAKIAELVADRAEMPVLERVDESLRGDYLDVMIKFRVVNDRGSDEAIYKVTYWSKDQ